MMAGGRLLYLWFLMGGLCLVEAWCIYVVPGETQMYLWYLLKGWCISCVLWKIGTFLVSVSGLV